MRKLVLMLIVVLLLMAVAGATVALADPPDGPPGDAHANDAACWGQASAVFAAMGEMGYHSSNPPDLGLEGNGRLGLRNLARYLADLGVIPDDSMQALGAFVAAETDPPLSIDACD